MRGAIRRPPAQSRGAERARPEPQTADLQILVGGNLAMNLETLPKNDPWSDIFDQKSICGYPAFVRKPPWSRPGRDLGPKTPPLRTYVY